MGIHQTSAAVFLADEGTEGSAGEYKDSGISCRNEKDNVMVGNYSLRIKSDYWTWEGWIYRELSQNFTWGDFKSVTFWSYRENSETGRDIQLFFSSDFKEDWVELPWGKNPKNTTYAEIFIGNDPIDEWVQYTLSKDDRDFVYYLDDETVIKDMAWRWVWYEDEENPNFRLLVDGLNIETSSGIGGGGGGCLGTLFIALISVTAVISYTLVRSRKRIKP